MARQICTKIELILSSSSARMFASSLASTPFAHTHTNPAETFKMELHKLRRVLV